MEVANTSQSVSVSRARIGTSQLNSIGKALLLIAVFEAIITIGWLAYEEYQPVILQSYGFSSLASVLIIMQGILGAILHPISGSFADKLMRRNASKFAVIITGAAFAAVVFMSVAFILLNQPGASITGALPIMVILWLAAMSIFHSPAISLIDHFVPAERFPQAAAKLTMAFGFIYAIEPILVPILDFIGLSATFVLGGILVLAGALAVKHIARLPIRQTHEKNTRATLGSNTLIYLFAVGILIGFGQALIFYYIPNVVNVEATQGILPLISDSERYLSFLLLMAAVLSLPVSKIVRHYKAKYLYVTGFFLAIGLSAMARMDGSGLFYLAIAILAGATYALLHITLLSYALKKTGGYHSGRGIGFAYGGAALATAAILLMAYMNGMVLN